MLVVFVDEKSDSRRDDLKKAAEILENAKIRVIIVALGEKVDVQEQTNTTLDRDHIVTASRDSDPGKTAHEIMEICSKLKVGCCFNV